MVYEEFQTEKGFRSFQITEVREGSNAEAAGIKVGDLLRGTTAIAIDIKKEADENALFSLSGGGLKPGSQRCLYVSDNQPFSFCRKALLSNLPDQGGPGVATLVIERNGISPGSAGEKDRL